MRHDIGLFKSHSNVIVNPFISNALFLYPLKTENRKADGLITLVSFIKQGKRGP